MAQGGTGSPTSRTCVSRGEREAERVGANATNRSLRFVPQIRGFPHGIPRQPRSGVRSTSFSVGLETVRKMVHGGAETTILPRRRQNEVESIVVMSEAVGVVAASAAVMEASVVAKGAAVTAARLCDGQLQVLRHPTQVTVS